MEKSPTVRDVGARLIAAVCLTNCRPGDVHKLLPRAMATGPLAPIAVTVARNARVINPRLIDFGCGEGKPVETGVPTLSGAAYSRSEIGSVFGIG